MERRTEIQSFFISAWKEGWRPDIEKTNAPVESVYDLLNFDWNEDLTLTKRSGYTQLCDITGVNLSDADFVLAPRVYTTTGAFPQYTQQVLHFNKSDGRMHYQSLGNLWAEYTDPGAGADLIDSTESIGPASDSAINRFRVWPINAITVGPVIYIGGLRFGGWDAGTTQGNPTSGDWATVSTNQDSQSLPIKYDVQTGTISRPAVHDIDDTTGGYVMGRSVVAKYARVFSGNVYKEGVYRYPSRLYWSGGDGDAVDVDEPEYWNTLNYITVGADDGQEIVALLSFGDQILIFKNQSVWTLVGTDDTTFALYQLDDRLGTEATYGVAAEAGKAYFLDERTGVWQYDGAEFINISRPIKDQLLGDLNREAAYKSSLDIFQEKLYVSIPTGSQSSSTTRVMYVYDMKLQVWTKYDYGFVPSPFPFYSELEITGPTVSLSNDLFAGLPAEGVFILNDGTTDDTVDIECRLTTPWINPGDIADSHRLRRLEVVSDEGDGAATLAVYRDLDGATAETTITHDPSGTTENYLSEYQRIDDYFWTWISLKLTQDSSATLNLYGLGFTISDRKRPRGTLTRTGYTA